MGVIHCNECEKETQMKARLEKKGWWVKGPKVD